MNKFYIKINSLAEAREAVKTIKIFSPDVYINSVVTTLISNEKGFQDITDTFPNGIQYDPTDDFVNMMSNYPTENHTELPVSIEYIDEC